jgi:hypothetical protein
MGKKQQAKFVAIITRTETWLAAKHSNEMISAHK